MEISKEFIAALGVRIRNLRKRLGLTQVAYASMINLDERNLRRIENGHQMPSHITMFQIAHLHKMHVSDLLKHLPHDWIKGKGQGKQNTLLDDLCGKWLGSVEQSNLERPYSAHMEIKAVEGIYTGDISIYVYDKESKKKHYLRQFNVVDILTHDSRICTILYNSFDSEKPEHGVFLIQLNKEKQSVSGAMVAYGFESKVIVRGNIKAQRIK